MKKGWEVRDFKDCLQKIKSTKKIPKKRFLAEGKYPIVSQEYDYINGFWNKSEDVLKVEKPIVVFGDHTKIVKYIDFDFVKGADGIVTLLPIEEIDSKFFAYQLQNIKLQDLGYARHYRLLKEKEIIFPNLKEQKAIIAKLDQAFKAIDQAKANIEQNMLNAEELFQSQLNQIFSKTGDKWREKKLKILAEIISGQSPKSKFYNVEGVGLPFYQGKKEFTDEFISQPSKWTSKVTKVALKDDILMSVRAPVGPVNFAINNKDLEVAPYIVLSEAFDANTKYLDTVYKALNRKVKKSMYGKKLEDLIKSRKTQEGQDENTLETETIEERKSPQA